LITGADGGLGKVVVKELVCRGATVIMGCLKLSDGQKAVDEIRKITSNGEMYLHQVNLANLSSVREFAKEIKEKYPHINILINNAGIGNSNWPLKKTKDGFEEHMIINYFGHFLLTNLLLDHVEKGAPARILFTASTLHLFAKLDLDDLNFDQAFKGTFDRVLPLPYGNSKLAMMLFAQELAEKLKNSNVKTYSYCPGLCDTPIFDNCTLPVYLFAKFCLLFIGHSADQGSKMIVYCSISKKCAQESGKMYRNNRVWTLATKAIEAQRQIGKSLWEISEKLVGI